MKVIRGGLEDSRIQALLEHHAMTARAETAPGSAHALDIGDLMSPGIEFWSAWEGDTLLGVGALKRLSDTHGEIKSMHTAGLHRRSGVGTAILRHIIAAARMGGLRRLSLETGSSPYFQPALALYRRHGFAECPPFGDYIPDPNSVFMTLEIPEAHRFQPLIDRAWQLAYRAAFLSLRTWWRIRHPRSEGSLVALWYDGRVLLVRTSYRRPLLLPGGSVRRGESPRDTALRELQEELAITLEPDALREAWSGTHFFEDRHDTVTIWAVDCALPPFPRIDNREIVAAFWCTPVEALAFALLPHVRDYLTEALPD